VFRLGRVKGLLREPLLLKHVKPRGSATADGDGRQVAGRRLPRARGKGDPAITDWTWPYGREAAA
jgi:hypothetical protein